MDTRRDFLRRTGRLVTSGLLLRRGLPLGLGTALLSRTQPAAAAVVLNTADTSGWTQVGNQAPTTSPTVLSFSDSDVNDVSGLFKSDPDAAPAEGELDLTTTFQVRSSTPAGADADFRVAMNDGQTRSAIAACVVINGVRGIGLVGPGTPTDPATYPAFAAADWTLAPMTLKLRRTADGGAELLELNGIPPTPRVFLRPDQVAPRIRAGATSELGCFSVNGVANVEVHRFFTEKPAAPVAGHLTATRFRIRDTDSSDRLRFRMDFMLGSNSNGIDPSTETIGIKLSTVAGTFYAQTLNGFDVRGNAPRRRWTLNDAERARTGIERFEIDEDPSNTGAVFLRDVRLDAGTGDFSTVNMEIAIGTGANADRLAGAANLVEWPADSRSWRLSNES